MNLIKPTGELQKLFDKLNAAEFGNKLPETMIAIQTFGRGKRALYGWCTVQKIWKTDAQSEDGHYEITICAEFLKRSFEEIAATMIHEMVHLFNLVNEIKDTSNNNVYHNKKFKKEAELHGLTITKAPTIGWSVTTLNDNGKTLVHSLGVDETAFDMFRSIMTRIVKKAPKQFTFTCPICNEKVRSTNENLRAFCEGNAEEGSEHAKELFVRK